MTEANFFVPGPTWVRPEILREMLRPMIAHRSAEFGALFTRVVANLKPLFGTTQDTFVASCSGTALLEAALTNCVPRRVLVTTCGAFGERWFDIGESLGLEVDQLNAGWGNAVDPQRLADHLASRRTHYDAVTLTHNETSTGVTNDVAELAQVVRSESPGTLILVDAVSSLGGIPVRFDEWGLDLCLASVQKGLALPPGITVFAVSANALERCRKRPYRGTYLDFLSYKKHGDEGNVPTTPSISHFYALAKQLDDMISVEGLEARYKRHEAMRDATIARTSAYAELASEADHVSATVTALIPNRRPDQVRAEMKTRGFTLGGGYGKWKETTIRIGHMGDIQLDDLNAMLTALDEVANA
jgi:aspartate aminotransferase-like enzyme